MPKPTPNAISAYLAKIGAKGGKVVTPRKLEHLRRARAAKKSKAESRARD